MLRIWYTTGPNAYFMTSVQDLVLWQAFV